MGPIRGGMDAITDNVIRKELYLDAHPNVVIAHTDDPWLWTAVIDYGHCVTRSIQRPELGDLLTQLEATDTETGGDSYGGPGAICT